ncbi:MAG: cysteine hydrolase [Ruminococcus sp.]|nr:cysteine hydrolase [Ruminococcus sp.]
MAGKKALIVIDMQNDYLWDKRKAKFSYDTKALTAQVNKAAQEFRAQGGDVIYIAQMFQDLPTNRLFIGFSIRGTQGAQLYSGLDVVSKLYFEKSLPNSFTAKKFREFMQQRGYDEIYVCGIDLCGCVGATALGAAKVCGNVFLLQNATGCRYDGKKQSRKKSALERAGVTFI